MINQLGRGSEGLRGSMCTLSRFMDCIALSICLVTEAMPVLTRRMVTAVSTREQTESTLGPTDEPGLLAMMVIGGTHLEASLNKLSDSLRFLIAFEA